MASQERDRRITDVGTLKALAHPLRSALYRGLTVARVATASQLAEQVDEAVSLVSYHLRKLAEHGLIEEAEPQSTDGRERWWQRTSDGLRIHDADFRDAPEAAAAHTAASRLFFEQRADMYRRFLDQRAHWSAEWNAAVESSESNLRLTAAELSELNREVLALLQRYDERGRAAEAAGDTEGRENVQIHTYAFPFRF
ncbi:winged helix-turn-helix domain-containing protein [Streptomyces acidiscabies]|uniref:Helix-turn-helix domain-containing protein n=1 Tax=Streptomyces acidiscabies TaxID=42234 RepID=A0AAP6B5S9_9ACTN|nr:helix-turn-helix domain-containing protein [Streptomyces acidiscabies]MBP5940240.1 helix-turn-helix transcriptional regulator [Streptomyces sp. LBUM 1476]MBZ3911467.1 helix-turn-helix transcriptional regulator [Streptomyces acidiscabies]MDX2958691.1 helix-turn-helix domain-containing protein [Streptomyces acidiscabies]MDX3018129.1 helix-turn-helix domain-containing protein [Streptomyces acidiscabies]MDX3791526.1 helix-turn-helix domain-containing protein [Streptomyces acidiscabies]